MRIQKIKNKKGFTILEILLSLCIVGIISATIYSTFWGGIRLSERAQLNGGILRDVRLSFELLKKDLENMVVYDFSNSYPDRFSLTGTESELTCIIPTPQGLKAVHYVLAKRQEGKVHTVVVGERYKKNVTVTEQTTASLKTDFLIREEIPFAEYLSQQGQNIKSELISDHVKENGIQFSYGYYADKNASDLSWVNEWKYRDLPAEVKVHLDFVSKDKEAQIVSFAKDIFIPTGHFQ